MKRFSNLALTTVVASLLIALAYFAYQGHQMITLTETTTVSTNIGLLPYYALRSFLRMLAAYVLSFLFTLSYGYHAGTNPRAERWLIPILDILQSVPILGFFPAAVYFFAALFHGHILGVELASIFLIFTSQAWNMTFGFYESIKTIPKDLHEVSAAFQVTGWRRYFKLYLPAGTPKLIYNSILSWAGGWYFLIAAEIIAIGPVKYSLPGLGSYLIRTTENGELALTLAGLLMLVALITFLNIFIWRPLVNWSDKFKYQLEGDSGSDHRISWGYRLWWEAPVFREVRELTVRGGLALGRGVTRLSREIARRRNERRSLSFFLSRACLFLRWALVLLLAYGLFRSLIGLGTIFLAPWEPDLFMIPKAIFFSLLRLLAAYAISLAWTVPVAIWIGYNEKAQQFLTPVFEVLASIPATALFPILVFILVGITGGMNLAAILLVLTGMQWYLLFNLIAGVRSIPGDLKDAADAFGLRGFQYLRRVVLPAMVPSLLTGSITAWGGGWNALIIAEYVVYAGKVYTAFGIGSLLDHATYSTGSVQLIWSSLIAMMVTIVLMNRFLWRRLYDRAVARFKIEG